jgi:ribokinase
VVLVIGSLNMDLVVKVDSLPEKGETIFGRSFARFPGGKGANQAIAAARMGARVTMVGCVGTDDSGKELQLGLVENHVDASPVRSVDECTGTALITVDRNAANTIIVVPGANDCVTFDDIDTALAGFKTPGILVLQHEIPAQAVYHAVHSAKEKGWFVILNPAPAREVPDQVMQYVDILIPNETEAAVLCKRPIQSVEDAAGAARELLAKGVKTVVITMGRQGALCCTNDSLRHVPPLQVSAVDSTAAGDAFVGALSCSLARGETLDAALQIASTAAALSVTRPGAQPSLPSWEEVKQYLR